MKRINYVKTPTVFQMEAADCGAASLASVLRYFGVNETLDRLRAATGTSANGCTAGNIMRAAKMYGLECHGYRMTVSELKTVTLPAVIFCGSDHFVVFEGYKGPGGRFTCINDPASGRRRLSAAEFGRYYSGVVLTFKPGPDFKKSGDKADVFPERPGFSGKLSGFVLRLIAFGLLPALPGMAVPVCARIVIDRTLNGGPAGPAPAVTIAVLAATLIRILLTLWRDRYLDSVRKKLSLNYARDILLKLFRLPLAFFEQRGSGDLAGRVNDGAAVIDFLAGELALAAIEAVSALVYLVLLLVYSPVMAAIAAAAALLAALSVPGFEDQAAGLPAKLKYEEGQLADKLFAGLTATGSLKAAGAEDEYVSVLLEGNSALQNTKRARSRAWQFQQALPEIINALAIVAMLTLGCLLISRGKLSAGTLAASLLLLTQFIDPAAGIAGITGRLRRTYIDISRAEDIAARSPDPRFSADPGDKTTRHRKLSGELTVRDLSFTYGGPDTPALSAISFYVPCGGALAITGGSGSGKSTLARLIAGLYRPTEGSVSYDGMDPGQIAPDVLSASIGFVSQHITLFSGTVRDNITMWNGNISEGDMIAAAKDACIHDFIVSKPGEYDYMLTERASNLSEGQKQRLEIARALSVNPAILVLDEATGALDPDTEKQVLDNIRRRGCTLILISQRRSVIRSADGILVLENGKIAGRYAND